VFILKGVNVVCFVIVLQVFILKGVRAALASDSYRDKKAEEKDNAEARRALRRRREEGEDALGVRMAARPWAVWMVIKGKELASEGFVSI
jgi:hypothetical protein